jgi:hypothetical protein
MRDFNLIISYDDIKAKLGESGSWHWILKLFPIDYERLTTVEEYDKVIELTQWCLNDLKHHRSKLRKDIHKQINNIETKVNDEIDNKSD